jgi:hypothetical protein
MSHSILDADARRRFARHILLKEIGELGQRRLSDANITLADGPEAEVACTYLRRAGVTVRVERGGGPDSPTADLEHLAGRPELRPAAEALLGCFLAVELIKRIALPGARAGDLGGISLAPEGGSA